MLPIRIKYISIRMGFGSFQILVSMSIGLLAEVRNVLLLPAATEGYIPYLNPLPSPPASRINRTLRESVPNDSNPSTTARRIQSLVPIYKDHDAFWSICERKCGTMMEIHRDFGRFSPDTGEKS